MSVRDTCVDAIETVVIICTWGMTVYTSIPPFLYPGKFLQPGKIMDGEPNNSSNNYLVVTDLIKIENNSQCQALGCIGLRIVETKAYI
jgi:hypothetical protein